MIGGTNSYAGQSAGDTKIMMRVETGDYCKVLLVDLDRIYACSQEWEKNFNAKKCKILEMGKSAIRPLMNYSLGNGKIIKAREEKGLRVLIQDNLSPEKHINRLSERHIGCCQT